MSAKIGDGGALVRRLWENRQHVEKERKRATINKARAARSSHKRTKEQRQAERDEIAAFLARVPPENY